MRNPWTDEVFRAAGFDFEAEARAKAYPLEVKILMLARLRAMDNEGARDLAARLALEIEADRALAAQRPSV